MEWVHHTIWWHVYPLGFCGAPIREADVPAPPHRLRRLLNWLAYGIELGTSGLLLGPIFASQTHGYDSLDQFRIDPRLGDDQDFDDLIAACRERGIRVVLDGVFSHVGAQHPELLGALRDGRTSAAADLFDVDWDGPGGLAPRVFEGHGDLVRLNHASDLTVDYVQRVMAHWLDRGIDGWRLDAAYSVDPAFWARVLPRVRNQHPDACFLGEVIHGDYSDFVATSGVDTVTQYELWKAIWSSLRDGNLFELDWTLQRHNGFLEHFTPNTFVGNHDVTRIASTLGTDGANRDDEKHHDNGHHDNGHHRNGQSGAVTALAILMTVGGIPSIYAGDEQGFTGVKEERLGGDDQVRPPFPDAPAELSDLGRPIYRAHQELLGLRRRHPWLTTATTEAVVLENARYSYRTLSADGAQYLDVHIDLVGSPTVKIVDPSGEVVWRQD